MKLHLLYVCGLLLSTLCPRSAETNFVAKSAKELIPGLVQSFPVAFHVPSTFVVGSVNDGAPDLDGGVLWAEKNSIAKIKKTKKLSDLPGAAVIVKISDGVMQTGPSAFSIDQDLVQSLPFKNLKTKKYSWNGCPVLSFEGLRPNGTLATGAWVGLNSPDGLTFFFDFRGRSKDGKLLAQDQAIWDTLLSKTSAP